ncbi:pectin acetylesterase-family hydrolase [Melittangium boletus]|uniref:pectin acetylesterase-family hydrolase n=1 Tax=Melittangium boletus TaxID=83453 RepID=UPI003DA23E96
MRWTSWLAVGVFAVGCGGAGEPWPGAESGGDVAGVTAAATATCGNGVVEAGELCDGAAVVSCSSLSGLYTAGQTRCASTCQGYEVARDCTRRAGLLTELVRPAVRDAQRWGDARCNDGTSFAFKFSPSPTGSKVWVINTVGGGYCDGKTAPCGDRDRKLTSGFLPADRHVTEGALGGSAILSRDPEENPTFAQANQVSGHYCSSDLWTGTQTTRRPVDGNLNLYFAGRLNARAMLDILRRDYGLDDRDPEVKVVFTGQSAGGQGAQNNADQLARSMPRAWAGQRLWILPVAGWMTLDWNDPNYTQGGLGDPDPVVSESLLSLYQAEFSPECRALAQANGRSGAACFSGLPAVAALHLPRARGGLGLRVLAASNRRDPAYTSHHGLTDTSAQTNAAMQAWDDLMTREMRESGVRWLFAPSDDPRVGTTPLHGVYEYWRVPFKTYSAANDACGVPYTVRDFRELVTRFFEDPSPDTSRLKVCFNGEWLP